MKRYEVHNLRVPFFLDHDVAYGEIESLVVAFGREVFLFSHRDICLYLSHQSKNADHLFSYPATSLLAQTDPIVAYGR